MIQPAGMAAAAKSVLRAVQFLDCPSDSRQGPVNPSPRPYLKNAVIVLAMRVMLRIQDVELAVVGLGYVGLTVGEFGETIGYRFRHQ